jgi:hypothetical protein
VYYHPYFGKRFINRSQVNSAAYDESYNEAAKLIAPSSSMVADFLKGFHYISH